jgi:hypothetical protein
MLVACIALVVALGGSAYAGVNKATIGTSSLKAQAVTTAKIADGAVTPAKLASRHLNCAPDTIPVGPGCVDTVLQPPAGLNAAISNCAGNGKRLPYVNELIAAHSRGVQLGDPELVADVSVNNGRYGQTVLSADARSAYVETLDTARRYRCVSAPTP